MPEDLATPTASRPEIPSGYLTPKLLPWNWAHQRLREARSYWIGSTTAAGHPHSRPVWAVWREGELLFTTGGRIGRNLASSPSVSVNLESGEEALILEGLAESRNDRQTWERYVSEYNPKYSWDFDLATVEPVWCIRPRVAFGWICDPSGRDGGALYSATATRWMF